MAEQFTESAEISMVKVPSIEAEVTVRPAEDGGRGFAAGANLEIAKTGTSNRWSVRVLDALSSRKSHHIEPGDDAFVVFLLIDSPRISYDALTPGTRFDIIDAGQVVGSGIVQARVD